jgi:hypothetical protein
LISISVHICSVIHIQDIDEEMALSMAIAESLKDASVNEHGADEGPDSTRRDLRPRQRASVCSESVATPLCENKQRRCVNLCNF